MTNKTYYTIRTFLRSNRKMEETGKIDTLTHIHMTTHFLGLQQAFQHKVAECTVMGPTLSYL